MKKRWLLVAAAVTLAVAVPVTVLAATGANDSVVDHHAMAVRTSPVQTSASSFQNVPGLSVDVFSVFGMSATVSVVLGGGPVTFRVVDTSIGGTSVMSPGPVTFAPTTENGAFTFHWVDQGAAASHDHVLRLQWKVGRGGNATLFRGDIDVLYQLAS